MSRRPTAGSDRAAQNAQTLKALVKLEGNKVCADCKRNKHPRWASWNLGIFVCIRCSGIHRGMGTHISRVKSVDLDAWTDEQLQSVIKWGNTRANKYWEAKLAPGHVPSEAKIENFIRTKYDSKRWVSDGPMPDPATLDTDDDVPLNIVQEKAKIERSASQRAQVPRQQQGIQQPRPVPTQNVDLFGDFDPIEPPARPSTAGLPATRPPPPPPATSKPKPQESLLGLDFLGGTSQGAGIGRPASATPTPAAAANARGDLKNSILSLYASAPKPQPQQVSQDRQSSFGGLPSPQPKQDAFGGLTDAFGGLSFNGSRSTHSVSANTSTASQFSGLSFPASVPNKTAPAPAQISAPAPLSGGSFFDSAPTKPVPKPSVTKPSNGLDFSFTQVPATTTTAAPSQPAPSALPANLFADDGFDGFASAAPAPPVAASKVQSPPASDFGSAFNLSTPAAPAPKTQSIPTRAAMTSPSNSGVFDPWAAGSDTNAWGAPEPVATKPSAPRVELGTVPSRITPNDITGGWGNPISKASNPTTQPTVTADEDFGGWNSAPTPAAQSNKPAAGFGGGSDPFDNPWG